MKNLQGKTAVITGASRGIGQAIAIAMAKQGCSLILHARREENLSATLAAVSDEGVTCHLIAAELDSRTWRPTVRPRQRLTNTHKTSPLNSKTAGY